MEWGCFMKLQGKFDIITETFIIKNILNLILKAMSIKAVIDKEFKDTIKNFNKTIAIKTRDEKISFYLEFKNASLKIYEGRLSKKPDATLVFKDTSVIKEFARTSSDDILNLLLSNKISFKGNMSYLLKFSYILNNFMPTSSKKVQKKTIERSKLKKEKSLQHLPKEGKESIDSTTECKERAKLITRCGKLTSTPTDNVKFLEEPYLQKYTIEDFPGLKAQRETHFTSKAEICTERARLITEYFMATGFEYDKDGNPRVPIFRQANALNYILSNKKPNIFPENSIAGSTTSKKFGVVLYPEGHGITLWPELKTIATRKIQPYDISKEDIELLDKLIFPYWADRNVREYTRIRNNNPIYQQFDEKFVLYFMWKTVALSHTIPDFPRLLGGGLSPIIEEASLKEETAKKAKNEKEEIFYQAIKIALEGILNYTKNLKEEAKRLQNECFTLNSEKTTVKERTYLNVKGRTTTPYYYQNLISILDRVPTYGATTLEEAVQSLWILWVALHNESTNAGLSLGHLDVWLQPYFEADMNKLTTKEEKEEYIRFAIELIGNLFFKCQDHLPLVANVGNKLFGGSSSDQAITVGGIDKNGNSAVCDMTYIFLKVTEMLTIRDPNMNARFYPGINSDEYLKRLIEVNLVTTATPSIHNDKSMIYALISNGFMQEDACEWVATGCVEPTIPGKHFGHTNSMMFNTVAALEMALYNGIHPLIDEQIGPKTGDPAKNEFSSFEDFYRAFEEQLKFLAYQAIDYNNALGISHQIIRPTPILSSMFEGPMEEAKDVTEGGAIYNSSGVACIGLTDIVDSLMSIKKLVYDEKVFDFKTLIKALKTNFKGYEKMLAMIQNKVPKFGSDVPEVNSIAQRVVDSIYNIFYNRLNYRGGHYFPGYWSMSNHVAFGTLSGALPSGRLRYKPFTPGLTPENVRDVDLLSSIRTIAKLPPEKMSNNIAFNVKITPDSRDSWEETINQITAYVKTYFELGGMQIQFNMVTTETLKDAMIHPENYRNLMVRISGYNAYFVELNREMQLEIIERQQITV